jgi:hypothetical protein
MSSFIVSQNIPWALRFLSFVYIPRRSGLQRMWAQDQGLARLSEGKMIKILTGDILESTAHTLVNTVNCVGVMGKGIALEFKNRFPEMFKDYLLGENNGYNNVVGILTQ